MNIKKVWRCYYSSRCCTQLDLLVEHYLPFARKVVYQLMSALPNHIKSADLLSFATSGLIKAIERFDPVKSKKFECYALWVIKGSILDELRKLDWIPRSVHQKSHRMHTALEELQQKLGREPDSSEVATYLNISLSEYDQLVVDTLPLKLVHLNAVNDYQDEGACLSDKIADDKARSGFEVLRDKERSFLLHHLLDTLNIQEKTVLMHYYYDDMTLKEIGMLLGVSESRVSQIHGKALGRMKGKLTHVSLDFLDDP